MQCDLCHQLTNPDDSEHLGVQNAPFVANDGGSPPIGYYGVGMLSLQDGGPKLGPYSDINPPHPFMQSRFHRSVEYCGSCHDVSNPVVGDLAHNHGAASPLEEGSFSGVPGAPVEEKAAFNNFPFQYGVVERTFSEHMASLWPTTLVSDLHTVVPEELRAGSVLVAYENSLLPPPLSGNDYEDGTPRYFTCQTCHMPPTTGQGCDKRPRLRHDLPFHDLTGGNYWAPETIKYLDDLGQLVIGSGLSSGQRTALDAGVIRARTNLELAASLVVEGNRLQVINLTGHKLISGYPEGRRMWVRIKWFDEAHLPLAEDGSYGSIQADIDGTPTQVQTILDLHPPYTRIFEVHGAMTQEWASQLLALGYPASLALSYDRTTGAVTKTLGGLGSQAPGTYHETFHFVLNNHIAMDNRIPPWAMRASAAIVRNIRPVPPEQYGDPGPLGFYDHFAWLVLNPPPGADHASIDLLYQPTSWEYIQFLYLANTGAVPFLSAEGAHMIDAWLNTGMATPHVMGTIAWSASVPACSDAFDNDGDGLADYPSDPGCAAPEDESENATGVPCDDRLDNDGDGLRDYPRDPGCITVDGTSEVFDDGDGVVDAQDNCPFEPNPGQADADGNHVGDACECGDVTNDGLFTAQDLAVIRDALAGTPPGLVEPRKCNVLGALDPADSDGNGIRDDCSIVDVVVQARALGSHAPGIQQVCDPALP